MISSRPYLARALYDWIVDNRWTPYIVVDATYPEVAVPERYIEDGKIVLNVSPSAVGKYLMNNDAIEFDASFGGIRMHVFVPIKAMTAIYAFENGRGMVFHDEEGGDDADADDGGSSSGGKEPPKNTGKGKPSLKVVK